MKKTISFIIVGIMAIGLFSCSISNKTVKSQSELISQNESLLEENNSLKQQLKDKTTELNKLKKDVQNQKTNRKYPPEIDEMLNIDDTTIFLERFKNYELSAVHPRSREMYQWVSNIHELGLLLQLIEKDHLSVENINSNLTNLPSTTIKQLESLNTNIKNNIRTADEKRELIEQSYNEMKKTFSLSQMDYYNSLVGKLNNFINIYFE